MISYSPTEGDEEPVFGWWWAGCGSVRGGARGCHVDEVELVTLAWVHWFNYDRLHGHCGDIPPAEFEAVWAASHPTEAVTP